MAEKSKSLLTRFLAIDERVIAVFVIILAVLPLLRPLLLPVIVTDMTKQVYNRIEALPPDSVVVVEVAHTVGVWTELAGPWTAVWQHLFNKPLKIIFVAALEDGALIEHTAIETLLDKGNKKYGVDWVELGFIAGGEAAVAAFAKDIHAVVKTDWYGNEVAKLPLMQNVKSAKDTALWFAGAGNVVWEIRQVKAAYNIDVIEIALSAQAPGFMPYLASGQLAGMLLSVGGGAEYELLMGKPGLAYRTADAINLIIVATLGLLCAGNIGYWYQRLRGEAK